MEIESEIRNTKLGKKHDTTRLAKFGTGNSKIENRNWEEKRKLEAGGGDVFEDQLFVHVEHLLSIEMDTCKSHPQ